MHRLSYVERESNRVNQKCWMCDCPLVDDYVWQCLLCRQYKLPKVFEICKICYKNQGHLHNNYPNLLRQEQFDAKIVDIELTSAFTEVISK